MASSVSNNFKLTQRGFRRVGAASGLKYVFGLTLCGFMNLLLGGARWMLESACAAALRDALSRLTPTLDVGSQRSSIMIAGPLCRGLREHG